MGPSPIDVDHVVLMGVGEFDRGYPCLFVSESVSSPETLGEVISSLDAFKEAEKGERTRRHSLLLLFYVKHFQKKIGLSIQSRCTFFIF